MLQQFRCFVLYKVSVVIQDAYNTDLPAGTRQWLRRLMALPMVPVARVPAVFNAVILAAPQVPQAIDMHRYMTATWIDPQSLYPPDVWNTYAIVSSDVQRQTATEVHAHDKL